MPFTRKVARAPQASGLRTPLGCASGSATSNPTAHSPAAVSHSSRALQLVELGNETGGSRPIHATCGGTHATAAVAANRFQVLRDAP